MFEITTIFFNEILSTPQIVVEIGPPEDPQLGGHSYFMIVKGATQEQEAIPIMDGLPLLLTQGMWTKTTYRYCLTRFFILKSNVGPKVIITINVYTLFLKHVNVL